MSNELMPAPGAAFLAVLSRELREPLRSAARWLSLLAAAGDNPDIRADAVRGIQLSLRRQSELAADLAEVSEIAAGRLAMTWTTFDILDALRESIADQRARSGQSATLATPDGNGTPLLVAGDRQRFQQVIDRLVAQSLRVRDATPPALIRARGVNGHCEIDVTVATGSTDGALIASDAALPGDRPCGALALVLARQLIEAHGGVLECLEDGRGRTFHIELPRIEARAAPQRRSLRLLEHLALLVIDDDDTARDALAEALGHFGARVTTARSVAEALEHLRSTDFAAVCSDIEMPRESGLVLARTRRAEEPKGRRQPLVAVSGLIGWEAEAVALQAGFDACIGKPVDVDALARRVRALVDAAEAADQLERNSPKVANDGT